MNKKTSPLRRAVVQVDTLRASDKKVKPLALSHGTAYLRGPEGIDKIDAKLTAGEAVLPVKTVQALGPENIEELIRATNDGKAPKHSLRDGGKYAVGVLDPEDWMAKPAPTAAPAARGAGMLRAMTSPVGLGVTAASIAAPYAYDAVKNAAVNSDPATFSPPATLQPGLRRGTLRAAPPDDDAAMRADTLTKRPDLANPNLAADQAVVNKPAPAAAAPVATAPAPFTSLREVPQNPELAKTYQNAFDQRTGNRADPTGNTGVRALRDDPMARDIFNSTQALTKSGITAGRDYKGGLELTNDPTIRSAVPYEKTQQYADGVNLAAREKAELAGIESGKQREDVLRRLNAPIGNDWRGIMDNAVTRRGALREMQDSTLRRGQDIQSNAASASREDARNRLAFDKQKFAVESLRADREGDIKNEANAIAADKAYREELLTDAARKSSDKAEQQRIAAERNNEIQVAQRDEIKTLAEKGVQTPEDKARLSMLAEPDGKGGWRPRAVGSMPASERQGFINKMDVRDKLKEHVEAGNRANMIAGAAPFVGAAVGAAASRFPGLRNVVGTKGGAIGGAALGGGVSAQQIFGSKGSGTVPSNFRDIDWDKVRVANGRVIYPNKAGKEMFQTDLDLRGTVEQIFQRQQDPSDLSLRTKP